ncbi:MAG: hypothetical protein FWF00_02055 [Endomicrobia bacterium]|nr:hypothetical protein [Endomicrobiia bacterium]MCL2506459.1 hypothetical protein [Endomicrobiia bacterium]
MKINRLLFAVFIILLAVFAVSHFAIKEKENKFAPVKQTIKDAHITVTAPNLVRNEISEQNTKAALQKDIDVIYFYNAEHKKISYTLVFSQYKKEANLDNGIKSIINIFENNNFVYEIKDNNIGNLEGKYIEGTYEKNDVKYGIKQQLVKKDKYFWQILVTFPFSEENDKTAKNYINSVEIDIVN